MKLERAVNELYRNNSSIKNFFDTADTVGTIQEFLEYSIIKYEKNNAQNSIIDNKANEEALKNITQAYNNIMNKYKK